MNAPKPKGPPWFAVDVRAWPDIADMMTRLGEPWPKWAIYSDLRWWADRERMKRGNRPGRPTLRKRWSVSDRTVRNALKAEDEWGDPLRKADSERTATGQDADRKADASPQNDETTGQDADSDRTASVPTRGIHRTQDTGHKEDKAAADAPDPVDPVDDGAPWWGDFPEAGSGVDPKKVTRWMMTVWQAWHSLGLAGKSTKIRSTQLATLRATKKKGFTPEQMVLLLTYAAKAQDPAPQAQWWRDTPGRTELTALLDNTKFDDRIAHAERWEAGEWRPVQATPTAPALADTSNTAAAELWTLRNAADLTAARERIKAEGGGWPELTAWLSNHVSHPDMVTGELRRKRAEAAK